MTRFAWTVRPQVDRAGELVEHAVGAERAGFEAVLLLDRGSGGSGAPWAAVAAAAAATRAISLIVVVSVMRHHPVALCEEVAAIADVWPGRLVLTLAAAETEPERAYGWDGTPNWERMGRLKEAIPLIRRLLSGEPATAEGSYYTARDARLPVHVDVPVLMVADGPSSAGMAGRLAEGALVLAQGGADAIARDVVEPLRAAAPARPLVVGVAKLRPDDPPAAVAGARYMLDMFRCDVLSLDAGTAAPASAIDAVGREVLGPLRSAAGAP